MPKTDDAPALDKRRPSLSAKAGSEGELYLLSRLLSDHLKPIEFGAVIAVFAAACGEHSEHRSGHAADPFWVDHGAVHQGQLFQRTAVLSTANDPALALHLHLQYDLRIVPWQSGDRFDASLSGKAGNKRRAVVLHGHDIHVKHGSAILDAKADLQLVVERLDDGQAGAFGVSRHKAHFAGSGTVGLMLSPRQEGHMAVRMACVPLAQPQGLDGIVQILADALQRYGRIAQRP